MDTGQTNDRSPSQLTGTTSQPSTSETLTNGTACKHCTAGRNLLIIFLITTKKLLTKYVFFWEVKS